MIKYKENTMTKKPKSEIESIDVLVHSSTPYDDVYRTMINDCPGLIIPVVNEVFNKQHRAGEEITVFNDNFFLNRQDGDQIERITDSNFQIENQKYHIECQSNPDGSILIRIFEYDTQIALRDATLEKDILSVRFPNTALLYLRHNKNTPDIMKIRIEVPEDYCTYNVPVMKVQQYTVDEIFEKKLYFLIPFHIFTYEHSFEECEKNDVKLIELLTIYQDIHTRLKHITEEGIISELIKQTIMDMSKKVLKQICIQYSNVQERMREVMGGQILEYEAKTIYRNGREDGEKQGIKQGANQKLAEQIRKKLAKGQNVDQIAEALEESVETIQYLIKEYKLI